MSRHAAIPCPLPDCGADYHVFSDGHCWVCHCTNCHDPEGGERSRIRGTGETESAAILEWLRNAQDYVEELGPELAATWHLADILLDAADIRVVSTLQVQVEDEAKRQSAERVRYGTAAVTDYAQATVWSDRDTARVRAGWPKEFEEVRREDVRRV